jgi:hypothetical protein
LGKFTQTNDYVQGDSFPDEVVEQIDDEDTMTLQVLNDATERAPKFKKTSGTSGVEIAPIEASKYLKSNTDGTGLTWSTAGPSADPAADAQFNVYIHATDGDYTSLAAYVAGSPATGDRVFYDADETLTSTITIPDGVTITQGNGRALSVNMTATTAITINDHTRLDGRFKITLVGGTITNLINVTGVSNDLDDIWITGTGGTITNGINLDSGAINNFGWLSCAGGAFTNTLVDNSGDNTNYVNFAEEGGEITRSSGANRMASPVLITPTIADQTNSTHDHADNAGGGATLNSPTIVTPTIASFTNATHDHSDAAGGGATLDPTSFDIGTTQIVDGIQTTVTDTDAKLPTSGAVVDYVTAQTGQLVYTTYTTTTSTTSNLPADQTIPQNTEGIEIMTRSITPVSASSTLKIDVQVVYSLTGTGQAVAALFVDSAADAVCVTSSFQHNGSTLENVLTMTYYVASASTSARTYKVRVGPNVGGAADTMFINRETSADQKSWGATNICSMSVLEII